MARAQEEAPRAPTKRIATLKHRAEFLRLRNGARCATSGFVLEGKPRAGFGEAAAVPVTARFGFTVSKQVGGAVERNRIKRRLKAAVRDVLLEHARHDYDYVLIARRPALVGGEAGPERHLEQLGKRLARRELDRVDRKGEQALRADELLKLGIDALD